MGKYISGLGKESNLTAGQITPSATVMANNKHQMKEQLAPTGRHDAENDYKRGDLARDPAAERGKGLGRYEAH
jgi:hypothetical protein